MALSDLDGLEDLAAVERQVHAVGHEHAYSGSETGVKNSDRRSATNV